jgi:putative glycosyltransferase (TIGR04372 family)
LKIVFLELHTSSLGHLVRDSDLILRRNALHNASLTWYRKTYLVLYARKSIANHAFWMLIRQNYFVVPRSLAHPIHRILRNISRRYSNLSDLQSEVSLIALGEIQQEKIPLMQMNLSSNSSSILLDSLEITKPYICLVIRDDGYDLSLNNNDIDELSYRNTPVEYFSNAVISLLEQGFNVIRMGRHSRTEIPGIKHRGYCDYSIRNTIHADMNDLMLFNECEFVITTGSGPDEIGSFFRKNIYRVNLGPVSNIVEAPIYPVTLLSDYVSLASSRKLSIEEIQRSDIRLLSVRQLNQLGISIMPKSAEAINAFFSLTCLIEQQGGMDHESIIHEFALSFGYSFLGKNILY